MKGAIFFRHAARHRNDVFKSEEMGTSIIFKFVNDVPTGESIKQCPSITTDLLQIGMTLTK